MMQRRFGRQRSQIVAVLGTVGRAPRARALVLVAACVAALALGFSGVAAHGGGGAGGHRGGGPEHLSTSVEPVSHGPRDDRGKGDDHTPGTSARSAEEDQAGTAPQATTTFSPGLGPRLSTAGPLPLPLPISLTPLGAPPAPQGNTAGSGRTSGGGTVATTTTAPPVRTAPAVRPSAPSGGGGSAAPPAGGQQPASLPPLVLIPPVGLPTPPRIQSAAAGSLGVVPLLVVILAMAALAGLLGLRLLRRSR